MKTYKLLILILVTSLISCENFLQEDFLAGDSTENRYSTSNGMEALVAACYATSKIWFAQEEGYDFSDAGTDIYDYGQQHPQQYQYTFTTDFNPTNSRLVVLWIEFYKGINACNDAIDYLTNSPDILGEELSKVRLSEGRFLRAL